MAERAIGKVCPECGTLTACAGSVADPEFYGTCAVCRDTVTAPNPDYVAPPVDHEKIALQQENENLKAQLAAATQGGETPQA